MNLIIDIGNTRAKLAVFKDNKLLDKKNAKHKNVFKKTQTILKKHKITNAIISSVSKLDKELLLFLEENTNFILLNNQTKIPFNNKYQTPATLGVDRMALIAAAVNEFPNKNVLVIDAGTCITYDFVNSKKEYFGGFISPGIQMRYNAMHHFTKKLPLLKPKINIGDGESTASAIHNGVLKGVTYEMEGIINEYHAKNNNLTIVLTGGDKKILSNLLKSSIFANPNFLLLGLNHILNYNLND
ncbi:MAG TPA: type III pantothenate kinase [Flavobacteriia bacterium]|nr:type III pantothenate kinase [Flavobacteriia bacterium]